MNVVFFRSCPNIVFDPEEPVIGSSGQEPETETTTSSSLGDDSVLGQVKITNMLLSGMILFIGVLVGIICMSHFWGRFRK